MTENNISMEFKSSRPYVRSSGIIYRLLKRMFDLLCAGIAFVVLLPVYAVIAAAIKMDSRGPVFFAHKRVGKNGKPIFVYKFRSMKENAEAMVEDFTPAQKAEWSETFKLEDDPRVTRVGKFLRKTYLDELPQLLNIIKGDLSFVGPRPVVEEEAEKYKDQKDLFLSVMPGLTGYWQVYAKDADYTQRIKMELYYVTHANIWWDVRILLMTAKMIVMGKDAVHDD